MKAVIPLEPLSGDVLAYTTSVDAEGPFVILEGFSGVKISYEHLQPRPILTRIYYRSASIRHQPGRP